MNFRGIIWFLWIIYSIYRARASPSFAHIESYASAMIIHTKKVTVADENT